VQFGFSAEQLAFRDAVRTLLTDVCPPAAVRAAWSGDGPGSDRTLWRTLGEMGVLGVLAPQQAGGLGLTDVDLVLVLEETGRAAVPGPVVEHAAVAVPLLAAARSGRVDATISGDELATFSESASRIGWGAEADVVLLGTDEGVRLLDPTPSVPIDCVDRSRRDVAFVSADGPLLPGADVGLALNRAALGTAAQQCGLAAHLIATTVDYTSARRQFGVPIGSYQALKHHLADALLLLEHARPAVYRAAWSIATGQPTRGRDVSMAKVMADRAAADAARVALQCHGAIGYTWEHDLHLWMKRVWVLERAWGTTAHHRAKVADAVLGARR
jgi:alkylation response protein AidB-like acyl-CoA dehydrogenase